MPGVFRRGLAVKVSVRSKSCRSNGNFPFEIAALMALPSRGSK